MTTRAPAARASAAGAVRTPAGRWTVEPLPAAADRPVARVLVESPLPHLDRPFDYLVPASLDEAAQAGVRVRVRFAGRDLGGVVLDRVDASEHGDRLDSLRRVVSAEPVLSADVARLLRVVADRWAGTAADVLRLAVPPRHAAVERADSPPAAVPPAPDAGGWRRYPGGAGLLAALSGGQAPRAVWTAASGDDWPDLLARALLATAASGRGAVAVLPDVREVDRLDAALTRLAGSPRPPVHAVLTAALGPRRRYRAFLGVRRGAQPIVVGTRAAAFAPVRDLGLVAIWDDGDDLHAEPRAPYPHAREVLLLRAHDQGCALLVGGYATTPEAIRLVQSGWARPVGPARADARSAAPRIRVADEHDLAVDPAARTARLPTLAWRTAREALTGGRAGAGTGDPGPVLVQVPRGGYLPALACRRCRHRARCAHCRGPLRLARAGVAPTCAWCGRAAVGWACPACGDPQLRAVVVGARRTAEELGRAFPGVVLRTSTGDGLLAEVGNGPALIVATPGAEPPAEGGYAAALLLDAWALLGLPLLRAGEEAVRRWLAATALVRPAAQGGRVVVVGAPSDLRPVQAVLRSDPAGFARAELADREAAGYPPAVRLAELTGAPSDVADLLALAELPPGHDLLGPVDVAGASSRDPATARALVRVPHAAGPALTAALHAAAGVRSARRSGRPVRVRIDPVDLG